MLTKLWFIGKTPGINEWVGCCDQHSPKIMESFRNKFFRDLYEVGDGDFHFACMVCQRGIEETKSAINIYMK